MDWSAAKTAKVPILKPTLRTLELDDSERDMLLVELAEAPIAHPRPSVPAEEVFAEIRAKFVRGVHDPHPWTMRPGISLKCFSLCVTTS